MLTPGCAYRTKDGSGCIADLKRRRDCMISDWDISKATGIGTYTQLSESSPGLYETFPDLRSGGHGASSLPPFLAFFRSIYSLFSNNKNTSAKDDPCSGVIPHEYGVMPPPNLASTILVENYTPADIKRMIIHSIETGSVPPVVESLIGSSNSYEMPELSIGAISLIFLIGSIIVSMTLLLILEVIRRK